VQVVGIPVGIPGEVVNDLLCRSARLPRCPRRSASGALPMPTIASDGWSASRCLAIRATIRAPLGCWAIATRMGTLFPFLFGHTPPLSHSQDQFDVGRSPLISIRSISKGSLPRFFSPEFWLLIAPALAVPQNSQANIWSAWPRKSGRLCDVT